MDITLQEYMLSQPRGIDQAKGETTETDRFYYGLAKHLARLWDNSHRYLGLNDDIRKHVVIAVVNYLQDVATDAGLWRAFTQMHEHLYGHLLPFYEVDEDYIPYELNEADVRFVIWYTIDSMHFDNALRSPLDKDIAWLAHSFFRVLDEVYIDAPANENYRLLEGDIDDPEQRQRVYEYGMWLFWNSYLMPGAAKMSLGIIMDDMRAATAKGDNSRRLDIMEDAIKDYPTGPLALMTSEWMRLMADNRMPKPKAVGADKEHKYYTEFVQATGGSEIAFFANYADFEKFLIDGMGWEAPSDGEAIFDQMKDFSNIVVLASRAKGILVAPEVAAYIAHPANALYDRELARREAHTLITEYGRCPMDLVRYAFANNLVPDAVLPCDATGKLLQQNWDFMARMYQQSRYND